MRHEKPATEERHFKRVRNVRRPVPVIVAPDDIEIPGSADLTGRAAAARLAAAARTAATRATAAHTSATHTATTRAANHFQRLRPAYIPAVQNDFAGL